MRPILLVPVLLHAVLASLAAAEPERPLLHTLFTDHAVLQRDAMVPIWGWTTPGTAVHVTMDAVAADAVADEGGRWLARIGPFSAGGPYTLTVAGPTTVTATDILVGDVWLCSGQSNMAMGIGAIKDAQKEIASADEPQIRLLDVPQVIAYTPQTAIAAHWHVCTPASVAGGGWAGFSAVGYLFGRQLHHELKIPIGLIQSTRGGTLAEAWTSGPALSAMPEFQAAVVQVGEDAKRLAAGAPDYAKDVAVWWQANDAGTRAGWSSPTAEASAWKSMALPQHWEEGGLPGFDGGVWFRRSFEIPDGWSANELIVHLGAIDDRDTTWIDGVVVGEREAWNEPRDYRIPAGTLAAGRHVIAVRVLDTGGPGGFSGKAEELRVERVGTTDSIPLAGPWRYREGAALSSLPPLPVRLGENPNVPTVLFNGMINPLVPCAFKGAIWYQGEANAGQAAIYRRLLPTLIADWRARFDVHDFPFLIVQLANYGERHAQPTESGWAELREAQQMTAQRVAKSGLAVAIDIGEGGDIHPKNKQDVAKRLAVAAQAVAYGRAGEFSGPVYRAMRVDGATAVLSFDHVGAGLVSRGERPLTGFAIAGDDRRFVWAEARIVADTVVVSSPTVEHPTTVRYGWDDNPDGSLANADGLPASPFRTDAPRELP
ncbi:MAG: 9-O-acetylesterase [Planctomycetes bacterium]|nr:9-O-acetylesterase [Planctomycetota bacterium]